MKRYLRAFAMCQSMFCALPCPWQVWDEEARPLMLAFLPLVGLEIGLLWAGLAWLCGALGMPGTVTAFLLCALPFAVTGHIHLDGFMDVTDAVRSCRGPERRREILKDPHVGSFAVIGCVLVIAGQFACFAAGRGDIRVLIFLPVLSRCMSAAAVTCLPAMETSQYAGGTRRGPVLWAAGLCAAAAAGAAVLLCGRYGLCLAALAAGYGLALRRGYVSLEGMNGDIAGYALTTGELAALLLYAIL